VARTPAGCSGCRPLAAALLTAFVLAERRIEHPLIDLDFVAGRPFAQAAVCAFTVGYVMAVAPAGRPAARRAPGHDGPSRTRAGGQIAAATGVLGIAVGLTITGLAAAVVPSAPIDETSVAAAVPNVVRTTGIAVAAAVSAAIITGAGLHGPVPAEAGFTRTFVAGAIAAGCALLAARAPSGRVARRAAA
jgi:hypothetical protein